MKKENFQTLSVNELKEKLDAFKKEMMEMQFKRRSGVEKPHLFKKVRKDIARILTVLRIKEKGK